MLEGNLEGCPQLPNNPKVPPDQPPPKPDQRPTNPRPTPTNPRPTPDQRPTTARPAPDRRPTTLAACTKTALATRTTKHPDLRETGPQHTSFQTICRKDSEEHCICFGNCRNSTVLIVDIGISPIFLENEHISMETTTNERF